MRPRLPDKLWAFSRHLHGRGHQRSARCIKMLNYYLHKCLLPAEASVGNDITLEHYGLGVVIHPQVEIGERCRILHHVTLASESIIGSEHKIRIGDDVTIGAHSIVVARGNCSLNIGDGAIVGAGSVVTKDIPPGEIWAGNPAHFLRKVAERNVWDQA